MTIRTAIAAVVAILHLLPATDANAAPTIEDFLRDADIRDAELSPDGKHLAMILNEGDKRTVVVRDIEAPGMPVIGAMADDVVRPSFLYWGNNDRLLISMLVPLDVKTVKREKQRGTLNIKEHFMVSRMISTDKDMKNMAILMEDERNLKRNVSLSRITNFLPSEPDYVQMAAYRNDRQLLYKVNILNGEAEQVAKGSRRTFGFASSEDGTPLYRFDFRERSKLIEIFKRNTDDDWDLIDKIPLSMDDESRIGTNDQITLFGMNVVYRKQNADTGFYDLVKVDRQTGVRETLVSLEGQDVQGALFSSRSNQIVGYRVEKDVERNVYFDPALQARYDAIAAEIGSYNFKVSGLNRDSGKALVSAWGADDPYSFFLWDYETSKLVFLDTAYRGLITDDLSIPAMVTYKTRDGAFLRAYVLLPQNFEKGKAHPTIVMPHGGPRSRSRPEFDDFAQFMSTRGFIVIEPNFRGSTGYGREFEAAGFKQWGGIMQDDITDAVNFMVEKGYTDPNKVCIVGASYGGYAALMGAIKTPELYQCAISLNGVTHLVDQVKYDMKVIDEEYWDELLFNAIGHPERDREMLDANSPALHADKIRIPILIVAGTDDDNVPYDQAKMMVKALKSAKADYEFLSLKDTGHNPFYYREDKLAVFDAVQRFLEMNLR